MFPWPNGVRDVGDCFPDGAVWGGIGKLFYDTMDPPEKVYARDIFIARYASSIGLVHGQRFSEIDTRGILINQFEGYRVLRIANGRVKPKNIFTIGGKRFSEANDP